MRLRELLKDNFFRLPLIQKQKENFKDFITKKLESFQKLLDQLDNDFVDPDKNIDTNFVKETQNQIIENLKNCIEEYYNGNPHKAYEKLNAVLKGESKDISAILNNKRYEINESFFRIRLSESNYPYKKEQMFHIPFELRNKVSTQRFSIPGFPSLYLGRTIYICWEELRRPGIEKIQTIRFKNIKPITLLDLTPPDTDCVDIEELYRFFMTFPLIMCCSVKVKDVTDTFKPEYIVPQLLLQWIRNNGIIDGIQYKSTHISSKMYNANNELINIVLPVKSNKEKGICENLASYFESTDVLSWNLYQFATGSMTVLYTREAMEKINEKIPNLEIIEGKQYSYSSSTLGRLEFYLENSETKPYLNIIH
ncbi:RES domain-containing protein [Elizabethkingia anophelis]|uniref:RES domain-containing protein n=1 Tax=Elizabethkingia anophelis TaxID=1117645 RepID=UPI003730933F